MQSFSKKKASDSVLDDLATSGGVLSDSYLSGMLGMCQIASLHGRGQRYIRQLGHYVGQGGILRISDANGGVDTVESIEKLRELILTWCNLDIVEDPSLRPARE